ncbi:MAG: carbohydrate ABC transporter permease [Erysipelotrichaceae bacterium]|nr:carbohydrate ABC transporter permease [Erysipelotrichaceae bacterium]
MEKTRGMSSRHIGMQTALNLRRFFIYLFLAIVAFFCLFPMWTLLVSMTRRHAEISTSFSFWFGDQLLVNLHNALNDPHLSVGQAFLNSLFISVTGSILCVYFSALTAYAIQVYDFKGKDLTFKFILIIMMIPATVSSVGLAQMLTEQHMTNMFWPLIIPQIASPVTFFYLKQYMSSILPMEMIEAARVDGAGEFRIFNQMALPLVKPALAVQLIFSFVANWNNFFIPALLINEQGKKTLPLIIAAIKASDPSSFDMGKTYALIGVAILPLVFIYLLLSRFIVGGMTEGSVKG